MQSRLLYPLWIRRMHDTIHAHTTHVFPPLHARVNHPHRDRAAISLIPLAPAGRTDLSSLARSPRYAELGFAKSSWVNPSMSVAVKELECMMDLQEDGAPDP